jgi:methionyl aminopeptidase
MPALMTGARLERMRRACGAAARVLEITGAAVRPGVTTDELDAIAHEAYIREGGFPSTLNYRGFPKSLCTSVNEVVCHGIPDSRRLESGDIVNLDVTIYLEGMHGDCSATFMVGDVDAEARRLVRVTEECLARGIAAIQPGRTIRVIGQAIEPHAAAHGYGVVRAYAGHGIGEMFHTPLQIPHYDEPDATEIFRPGMVFTVEPMITEGTWQIRHWNDGWTVVTADGKRSAQFEHTVLVTDGGAEILTVP